MAANEGASPVSVLAIADTEHFDPLAVVMKTDAKVPDAEAEFRWVDTLQALDVASTGFGETVNRSQDAQGDNAAQTRQVRFGPSREDDALDQDGSW